MPTRASYVLLTSVMLVLAACDSDDEVTAPMTGPGGSGQGGSGAQGGAAQGGSAAGGSGAAGASGGAGGSGGTVEPEGLAVVFPPLGSLTSADELSVRGSSEASYGITAVTVGSVAATSSDSFATWRADVPLTPGAQSLAVSATGSMPATHPPLDVERNGVVEAPDDLDFDAANNRAFVAAGYLRGRFYQVDLASGQASLVATFDPLDGMVGCAVNTLPGVRSIGYDSVADELIVINSQCIVRVDVQTGVRTLIQDSYPASFIQRDLAVDVANGRALVLDYDALYAVSLTSGAFSVISDSGTGSGPDLNETTVMAPDLAGGRVLVLQGDFPDFALIAVDVSSGNRTALASSSIGSGPVPYSPEAAAYDPVGNRTLVGDSAQILAIDHATGDRSVLSDQNNQGPAINVPRGIALDSANGRLIETDLTSHVLAVDLASGHRSTLYDYAVGSGPSVRVAYLAVDPATGDVYAAPVGQEYLRLDRSGNRTAVSSSGATPVGTGPSLNQMRGSCIHPPSNEALVVGSFGLLSIDLTTGDRTELSGGNVGSGPAFVLPEAVAVHPSGNPIWVIDSFAPGLFEVERSTGERTIIANNSSIGSGPAFGLSALEYDGSSLIVIGQGSVLAIDPATGNRTVISDAFVGSGPPLSGSRLALDPSGNTVYVVFNGRVMSVDKASGDRTVIADHNVGRGPLLSYGFIDVGPDGIIWLAGDAGYSIGAIDPVTGDRVVAAK